MAKTKYIELGREEFLPIIYEDRTVMAIDKPAYWMLVPFTWQRTNRNLQAAITSSIAAGEYWAKSRNLKFLKFVHRLDADTTGVLLFAKTPAAVETISNLFESRLMEKRYLAVVEGTPREKEWKCCLKLSPDPDQVGRVRVDEVNGKIAETHFTVLQSRNGRSLIEARPVTGRTHQIRVHLAETGSPIVGDPWYGEGLRISQEFPLGLRAVFLSYRDPFTRQTVYIRAKPDAFLKAAGFGGFLEAEGQAGEKVKDSTGKIGGAKTPAVSPEKGPAKPAVPGKSDA